MRGALHAVEHDPRGSAVGESPGARTRRNSGACRRTSRGRPHGAARDGHPLSGGPRAAPCTTAYQQLFPAEQGAMSGCETGRPRNVRPACSAAGAAMGAGNLDRAIFKIRGCHPLWVATILNGIGKFRRILPFRSEHFLGGRHARVIEDSAEEPVYEAVRDPVSEAAGRNLPPLEFWSGTGSSMPSAMSHAGFRSARPSGTIPRDWEEMSWSTRTWGPRHPALVKKQG